MVRIKYKIYYDAEISEHLEYIERKYWRLIREEIELQLVYQPDVETKNRKPLKRPPIDNKWEIRFGPDNIFRVFYSILFEKREVWIHMIARKINNKLFIGAKEIDL